MNAPRRLAALFALLVVLATAAFVIGVSVETNQENSEAGVEETHTDEGSQAPEEGESEETGGGASEETESNSGESESETIIGINTESTPLIVLGAAFSLALAGAVLRWPRREAFAVAAVFCLGFAALDGRELAHQLDENGNTIAVLAGLTLVLHLAAAAVAALAVARTYGEVPAESSA